MKDKEIGIKVTKEEICGIYSPDKISLKEWIRAKKIGFVCSLLSNNKGVLIRGTCYSVETVLQEIDKADSIGILDERRTQSVPALAIVTKIEGTICENEEEEEIGHGETIKWYDIGIIIERDLIITEASKVEKLDLCDKCIHKERRSYREAPNFNEKWVFARIEKYLKRTTVWDALKKGVVSLSEYPVALYNVVSNEGEHNIREAVANFVRMLEEESKERKTKGGVR